MYRYKQNPQDMERFLPEAGFYVLKQDLECCNGVFASETRVFISAQSFNAVIEDENNSDKYAFNEASIMFTTPDDISNFTRTYFEPLTEFNTRFEEAFNAFAERHNVVTRRLVMKRKFFAVCFLLFSLITSVLVILGDIENVLTKGNLLAFILVLILYNMIFLMISVHFWFEDDFELRRLADISVKSEMQTIIKSLLSEV